jgi:membrane protein
VQTVSPESPEARRKRLAIARARVGKSFEKVKPGTRPFEIMKRVSIGVYSDGFIHAGNLAYLALLTIFPFVIVAAAVARLFGASEGGENTVIALFQTMPPSVQDVLRQPIQDVLQARSGNLLWLGALVGLWTTGSFIETIRDVIRRAYGVPYSRPFWEYRLGSLGMIFASVFLILIAFAFSVFLSSAEQFVAANLPGGEEIARIFTLVRFAPALILFGSLYLLFRYLTPKRYRGRQCHKWPGPLVVTVWWLATTAILPRVLSSLGSYDLTYGSLAGVIIALFFFFVIGLGVSVGAQLNAALAEPPEPTVKDVEEARLEEAAEQAAEASRAELIEEDGTE